MLKAIIYAVCILYVAPQIFLILDYPFEALQVLIIIAFFFVGVLLAQYQVASSGFIDYSDRFFVDPKVLYLIFIIYISSRFGIVSDIISSLFAGEFMSFALENAVQRYKKMEEESQQTIFERIGSIAFLMSGSIAASIKTQRLKVHLLLGIMIFIASTTLTRLGVLIVFVTYFVEFVIRSNVRLQDLSFMKTVRVGIGLLAILLVIFLFSAYGRISDKEDRIAEILLMKIPAYTIAMYEALLIWMQTNSDQYASYYGSATFASVFKMFSIEFKEGFYYPVSTTYGNTNIYTNIRGFLSDFGLIGSSILMAFFGYMVSLYSRRNMTFFSYNVVRLIMIILIFCLFSPLIHFNTLCALLLSGIVIAGVKFPVMRNHRVTPSA